MKQQLRINRNIVECKYSSYREHTALSFVLIETLWNVNHKGRLLFFNRVIVLIETLWNVNVFPTLLKKLDEFVLIETLWNVNGSTKVADTGEIFRINRNIVECKLVFQIRNICFFKY